MSCIECHVETLQSAVCSVPEAWARYSKTKLEVAVKKKLLELDKYRLRKFLVRALLLILSPPPHRVRWWLSISLFLMFVTFKKSYPFRGSTHAAD